MYFDLACRLRGYKECDYHEDCIVKSGSNVKRTNTSVFEDNGYGYRFGNGYSHEATKQVYKNKTLNFMSSTWRNFAAIDRKFQERFMIDYRTWWSECR